MRIYLPVGSCFGLQVRLFSLLFIFFLKLPLVSLETHQAHSEIIQRINSLRQQSGLSTLYEDKAAAITAYNHAQELASRKILSHFDKNNRRVAERYRLNGGTGIQVGENLGVAHSASSIFNAWLESKSHKENILNPLWNSYGMNIELLSAKRIIAVIVFSTSRIESLIIENHDNSLKIEVHPFDNLTVSELKTHLQIGNRKYEPQFILHNNSGQRKIQFIIKNITDEEKNSSGILMFNRDSTKIITDSFFLCRAIP